MDARQALFCQYGIRPGNDGTEGIKQRLQCAVEFVFAFRAGLF